MWFLDICHIINDSLEKIHDFYINLKCITFLLNLISFISLHNMLNSLG